MFIEKEPAAAVDNKKKDALKKAQEPPVVKKTDKTFAGKSEKEQRKMLQPKASGNTAVPVIDKKKDPYSALKQLFRQMNLPEKLAPANVQTFQFDPATGTLNIQLKNAFSQQVDGKNTLRFDAEITGTLAKGALSGISGITKDGLPVTAFERSLPGMIRICGEFGSGRRSIDIKDFVFPSL